MLYRLGKSNFNAYIYILHSLFTKARKESQQATYLNAYFWRIYIMD